MARGWLYPATRGRGPEPIAVIGGAGGGPPSGPAGGDLSGTYPNPTIGAGTVTRAKTAADLWLSPIPTAGDVGDVLTVTAGPSLAWEAPAPAAGFWADDPGAPGAGLVPVPASRWIHCANDTGGLFFGPAATPGVSGTDTAALNFWTGVTGYVWHGPGPGFAPIAALSPTGTLTVHQTTPTSPILVAGFNDANFPSGTTETRNGIRFDDTFTSNRSAASEEHILNIVDISPTVTEIDDGGGAFGLQFRGMHIAPTYTISGFNALIEGVRGGGTYTNAVSPVFGAFTLFHGVPVLTSSTPSVPPYPAAMFVSEATMQYNAASGTANFTNPQNAGAFGFADRNTIVNGGAGSLNGTNYYSFISKPTFSEAAGALSFATRVGYRHEILGVSGSPAITTDIALSIPNTKIATVTNAYSIQSGGVLVAMLHAGPATFGINAPILGTERVRVTQPTLGNQVVRLDSTATADDPTELVTQQRVATTDGTQTTLQTIAIPASTTLALSAVVIARRTGGTAGTAEDAAAYAVEAVVKNVAGTATLVAGSPVVSAWGEDQAGWDATVTVSAATALLRVTGAANNTVTWHTTTRTWQVST